MCPIRCYITNGRLLPNPAALLNSIARNAREGVDWIQIREKELSARDLFAVVRAAKQIVRPYGTKLLVSIRLDVALAAGADGVHLPEGSPEPNRWRPILPGGFLMGVSCHTVAQVREAEESGANYALFGPVFAPLSKSSDLAPRGLDQLREAAGSSDIPVLALGGITKENAQSCLDAGASGVAGISLFL